MSSPTRRSLTSLTLMLTLLLLAPIGTFAQDDGGDGDAVTDQDVARQALRDAAAAYENEDWPGCLASYEAALAAGASSGTAYYNAACCAALTGQTDRAFDLLQGAVAAGDRDADWPEQDTDLASLRDDPRWTTYLDGLRANEAAYVETIHGELYRMYRADQADRRPPIDWETVSQRDAARLARAKELVEAGELEAADDYFHAAMILQHSHASDDYRLARDLARKAAALDPDHRVARWLSAAAHDRYLQSIDQPQVYGTQMLKVDGRWTLEPIDDDAVTDAERAALGVPPLARAYERMERMNAQLEAEETREEGTADADPAVDDTDGEN